MAPERGVTTLEPRRFADAIVGALERPRFDVPVPPWMLAANAAFSVLPRRARDAVNAAMRLDRMMLDADERARRGYDARIAVVEPTSAAGSTR